MAQTGQGRQVTYRLAQKTSWHKTYAITEALAEDVVWRTDIAPWVATLPPNVIHIWHYGFTEMLNNAIEHSGGQEVTVWFEQTAASTQIRIVDDGVGIFKKIQAALNLLDERHAVLELAKGKLTTDPTRHSGEGIFFSSRMFDDFFILAGGVFFAHSFHRAEDWISSRDKDMSGTTVSMTLNNHTPRTTTEVFDMFTSDETYGFTKTVVEAQLVKYGDENLILRSQARRLLARLDKFKMVILDFTGVALVGQAFADEIFRVFQQQHPELKLLVTHANPDVERMILRAKAWQAEQPASPSTP